MKSKNLKAFLIISTIFIWGIIAFKIISFLKTPDVSVLNKYQKETVPKEIIKKETFEIVANYRDPFLVKKINTENVNNIENKQSENSKSPRASSSKKIKNELNWPIIRYKGQILNTNSQKQTGMLTINNKEFLVTKEIEYEEIYVDYIYKDSIRLIYQNEIRTFKKK